MFEWFSQNLIKAITDKSDKCYLIRLIIIRISNRLNFDVPVSQLCKTS